MILLKQKIYFANSLKGIGIGWFISKYILDVEIFLSYK
ncbi:hypothetical protein FLB_09400 [Flavobacterium succinicans]|uniref:Uncharacterized protein n=1 Tax=Flavobacterium succinicans TaxID=29536 RepID=A0A199XUU3_9FLAO|nr:hypothetical protein FLB_09400 [Flavobacterium succinicans]